MDQAYESSTLHLQGEQKRFGASKILEILHW